MRTVMCNVTDAKWFLFCADMNLEAKWLDNAAGNLELAETSIRQVPQDAPMFQSLCAAWLARVVRLAELSIAQREAGRC